MSLILYSYAIMLQCWSAKPESRPSFSELERRFGSLIEETESTIYVRLNESYLQMNSFQNKSDKTNYMEMNGIPQDTYNRNQPPLI